MDGKWIVQYLKGNKWKNTFHGETRKDALVVAMRISLEKVTRVLGPNGHTGHTFINGEPYLGVYSLDDVDMLEAFEETREERARAME